MGVHRGEPDDRGTRVVRVPADRAAVQARGHNRRAVAGDADVDLGDRDLDAVRGRDRLDGDRPGRSRRIPPRSAVAVAARVARAGRVRWSQVATAHLSHGLVVCTALLVAYLVAGLAWDAHDAQAAGDQVARPVLAASARAALFLVAMPPVAGDPASRIDALEASSPRGRLRPAGRRGRRRRQRHRIDPGQRRLGRLAARVRCDPGAYAGAAILLGVPVAWRARRHRALASRSEVRSSRLVPDARRGRLRPGHPRAVPAHPVRRRLPAQPGAHALPRGHRDPGARRGRHPVGLRDDPLPPRA